MTITLVTAIHHHPSCPTRHGAEGFCPCPTTNEEPVMDVPAPEAAAGRTYAPKDLTLDLTAAAIHIAALSDALWTAEGATADNITRLRHLVAMWEDLTGIHGPDAITLAREIATHPSHITAAVVPF